MFIYPRRVRVQDTDTTGVLYFANLLQITLEAFEEFLLSKEFFIQEMVSKYQVLLPIVHTEGDFFSPIRVGDMLHVHLSLKEVGKSSFSYSADIFQGENKAGAASIVHVAYCSQKSTSIPIPEKLKVLVDAI